MKIKLILLLVLGTCAFVSYSQSTLISPGSVLPQMTTTQRTALSNPANGMLVFDISTNSYWFRQNTAWVELPKGGSTSNYWQLNGLAGNELKNTNSGGLWSANPVGLFENSSNTTNPPTAPVNGNGTRLMWIPARSAFRVGTVAEDFKSWDADSIGLFSFASGYNAKAKGYGSIAMGYYNVASGVGSTSLGLFTGATGESASALGYNTQASGQKSVAMGADARATGDFSTAMGNSGLASGEASTVLGKSTWASGYYSLASGWNTKASGTASVAMGYGSEVNGSYSFVNGYNSIVYGDDAAAIGFDLRIRPQNGFVVGIYNDTLDWPNPAQRNLTDRLFQIGNGSSDVARSNAMTVLRNGYIGTYNVTDPQANLHLQYAGTSNWDAHLRLQYSPTEYGNIVYDDAGLKFRNWGIGDNFYFRNRNNTWVATIFENGNMTIAGTLTQNSDSRLKTNCIKVQNSRTKLAQLQAYNYHWKATDSDPSLQTGLIAQEVQKQFPELVSEGENGYLSVNYIGLIPHLIESQKELNAENEALKARLLSIEKKLETLKQSQTASLK